MERIEHDVNAEAPKRIYRLYFIDELHVKQYIFKEPMNCEVCDDDILFEHTSDESKARLFNGSVVDINKLRYYLEKHFHYVNLMVEFI